MKRHGMKMVGRKYGSMGRKGRAVGCDTLTNYVCASYSLWTDSGRLSAYTLHILVSRQKKLIFFTAPFCHSFYTTYLQVPISLLIHVSYISVACHYSNVFVCVCYYMFSAL